MFSVSDSHAFYTKGTGYQRAILDSTCAHAMRNNNQILHDKIVSENFTGSTAPPALSKTKFDRNSDARSVCGS